MSVTPFSGVHGGLEHQLGEARAQITQLQRDVKLLREAQRAAPPAAMVRVDPTAGAEPAAVVRDDGDPGISVARAAVARPAPVAAAAERSVAPIGEPAEPTASVVAAVSAPAADVAVATAPSSAVDTPAADVAASLGVKIYTVGAAPDFQERQLGGFFTDPQVFRTPVEIDEGTLKKVAEVTGGKYFRARDENSLKEIYQEIDKLERTVVDEQRFQVWHELATDWVQWGNLRVPPILMIALGTLALEQVLAFTVFRRIP